MAKLTDDDLTAISRMISNTVEYVLRYERGRLKDDLAQREAVAAERRKQWERVNPPQFKRIEQYTDGELTAAIERAEFAFLPSAMSNDKGLLFWKLTNGIDAFFERRRRERGFGFHGYGPK